MTESTLLAPELNDPFATLQCDRDGRIVEVNRHFAALVGLSPAELVGRRIDDLVAGGLPAIAPDEGSQALVQLKAESPEQGAWLLCRLTRREGPGAGITLAGMGIGAEHARAMELAAERASLDHSQAIIEFDPNGTILAANALFLGAMGYRADEIVGRHHRMFVDPAFAASEKYESFWKRLRSGEAFVGEYERVAKGGRRVWILASYNPIHRPSGELVKVIKFAVDVTSMVEARQAAASTASELGRSSEHLETLGADLSGLASVVGESASKAAASMDRMGESSRSLASATEEMTASIAEISANAQNAAGVATEAVNAAAATESTIRRLGHSSEQIGQVVKLINSIATQTNLLALNATIEAARAGNAGRGFAVVANEVKELAKETASATDDISRRVAAIQGDTAAAVDAIERIRTLVEEIDAFQSTIACAVEEQSATTVEMARSVAAAALEASDIQEVIEDVVATARKAEHESKEVRDAASRLSNLGTALLRLVER